MELLPLLAVLLSAPLQAAGFVKPAPPNIVVILIDDMGYADIGPFGATLQKTPALDRMAKEGMRLTSFYAAPVCSVSRAQLMTGCYGVGVSVPGVFHPGSPEGLNPAEYTIAERLKERGYTTACVGKWHLGDQPEFLPTKQGFDRYFGIPYSNDMLRKPVGGNETVVPLMRDERVAELMTDEQQSTLVARYTDEAVRFLHENKDRPFFLYFPHSAVHTPIHPGAAFAGKSANGRFGDWVEEVDWSVGRVLDTLRELGIDQNTLVVFTSDNGPWLIRGADGGSALPLRGGKGSTWEGGVRVPTLAWWPGQIAPGSVCDAVAGTIDLLPTCVSLAGGSVPAEPVIDGRDISPLLLGNSIQSPREAHYYFKGYELQAVRQGPWKLAIAAQRDAYSKADAGDVMKNPRLYNLDQEIGEQTDLSDQHPDIVAQLRALADTMDAEIGGDTPRARRPAGKVDSPATLYPLVPKGATGRKKAARGGETAAGASDLAALVVGGSLSGADAPQVAGVPFTLSCTIETAQPDAIILAHGGKNIGYALHLRGGRVVFTVHDRGSKTNLGSAAPLPGGPQPIAVSLARDGTLTLKAGGRPPVTGKIAGLLSRQPMEDFCLGYDSKIPVTDYAEAAPFRGRITGLAFSSP